MKYVYDSGTKQTKVRSLDRIISLTPKEGKHAASSSGLIDKGLFVGTNKLHAVYDAQTNLWFMRYDSGLLPEPLRQKFTSFTALMKFVVAYFDKRNIEIKEVID